MRPLLIGLVLSSALGGSALAQQGPPDPARLHDDLHLSADQDPAWRQYLAAMNDGGRMMSQRRAAETLMPQLPTPRRLALMQATLEQEVEGFRRQTQAINAFYGRLTADQQRTFDRETLPQQGGQPSAPQR